MNSHLQCKHRRKITQWSTLVIFVMLASLLLAGCAIPATMYSSVQPELLALAAEHPESFVRVIVQKRSPGNAAEQLVTDLGGIIVRDLSLINGFAAELPAAAVSQLAGADSIRWVSLDAPMESAQVDQGATVQTFTSWSSALGERGWSIFYDADKLVDSAPGPNGTFSVAYQDSWAYAGSFVPLITSSQRAITKVEVVLHGFADAKLDKNITLGLSVAGLDYGEVVVPHQVFDNRVGYANRGSIYVDITGTKQDWQWSDLANRLEILIDHTGVGPWTYYDAIGLRVTGMLSTVSTTWASAIGTKIANAFTQSAMILDASTGPAATYGYGSKVKGSFAGFDVEVTPDHKIRKVEAVLYGYASRSFTTNFKLKPHIDGSQIADINVNGSIFSNRIGATNAGPIYVDITGSRAWTWGDFDRYFELVFDQGMLSSGDLIYYDAIGLRVSTQPGVDLTGACTRCLTTARHDHRCQQAGECLQQSHRRRSIVERDQQDSGERRGSGCRRQRRLQHRRSARESRCSQFQPWLP